MVAEAFFSDETAIIIQREGGSEVALTTKVLSINESGFERETESTPTFGSGNIVKKMPQKEGQVEVEVVVTNTTFDRIFWGDTGTAEVPATVYSGGDQQKYRITLIRTKASTLPTSALSSITGETYRRAYVEAYAVTFEPEQAADDFMKGKLTFKIAPTDSSASPNVRTDYNATSLTGFSAYTTSNKW